MKRHDDPDVLDDVRVMQMLNISERTLRRWLREEGLPHAQFSRELRRYVRADVLAWMSERSRRSVDADTAKMQTRERVRRAAAGLHVVGRSP